MARTQAVDYERRKEAIVERAADLFAAGGFRETSVQDIADACGAAKSLLYHYFPSKEEVLFAVMSSHIDRLLDVVDAEVRKDRDPATSLRDLLRTFMEEYVGAASRQKVLLNELDSLPPAWRAEIVAKQRRILSAVQQLVAAVAPQRCATPTEARATTMLLFGAINWTANWFNPSGRLKPAEIADMAFDLVAGRDANGT